MPTMEPLLNDNGISQCITTVAQIKAMPQLKSQKTKETAFFLSSLSELNANGLQGTSNTTEFVIKKLPKTKSLGNNVDVIINYAGDDDWSKDLPNKKDLKKKTSAAAAAVPPVIHNIDLSKDFPVKIDNVLPVIKNNMKNSKPNAFQLQAEESYNNQVKMISERREGKEPFYFRFVVEKSHEIIRRGKLRYQCHICKGEYTSKFSMKRHFLRSHINSEYLSVSDKNNCNLKLGDKELEQFVEENKTPSGRKRFKIDLDFFVPDGITKVKGLYKCHNCTGMLFDIERELVEHHQSYHSSRDEDGTHPCPLCPSVFQKKQALSKHKSKHAEKKTIFHCEICSLQFEKITDFTRHLQSHGNGKQCKYCDKEFSTPANRKRHENIHERGIGVFTCKMCLVKFPRSKDLEKHIKKMHCGEKLFCLHCPKQANPVIYTSHNLLEAHITLMHQDIPGKKFGTSNKAVGIYKTHIQKSSKDCFCCFCKKKFSTVKAMVSHKNLVHKIEMSQRKPKKFGQKELTKEKSQGDFEGSGKLKKFPSSGKGPGEKNVASKADDQTKRTGILGKKRTTYERKAKSSSQHKVSKDKSYRKKDEAEKIFFANVSSNVANNLLNHVDGGPNQINLKISSFEDQNESLDYRSSYSEIPWSANTLSNHVDLGYFDSLCKRGERSQLLSQEHCLYATGLKRNEVLSENALNLSCENSCIVEETAQSISQDSSLILEEKDTLINHEISATYVCDVCKGTFSSYSAFEDHSVNNHPNVEVSFVEIEGTSKNPPKVPEELRRPLYTQPNGILISCEAQSPIAKQFDMKCTKCETRFNDKNQLYDHILQCGNETRDFPIRRKINQKNRKALATKSQSDSAKKPIQKSPWFTRNKQIFKSGCYRRNKFQGGKYFFNITGNKRGRRRLPLPSKLRPNPCPHCESVFISSAKLPEHVEVCTYRFKGQAKKRKNDRSPELSPSPITVCENGGSSDLKNSDILDKDTSLLSYSNDHVLSTTSQSASSYVQSFLLAKHNGNSILEDSCAKKNRLDLNCKKAVSVQKESLNLELYRMIVRETLSQLDKEDASESCAKRKELMSVNSSCENMVKSSVDNYLVDNSRKNASTKSVERSKSENILEPFTTATKETSPILVNNNLPKIKEVVKEIQLAASSLPSLKKSNSPLAFLSPEATQNVSYSSNNKSSLQTGLNSQSEKEASATNESQRFEKARQRKKRKPVKRIHKMTNEADTSLKTGLSPFPNKTLDSCLSPFSLESSSFKPIENSGELMLSTNTDSEILKLPDLVPEKDKTDFQNSNEKCSSNGLESSIASSENSQVSTGDGRLSNTVFLPEDKPEGSGDRDSPSLELLVSSVTQSIENFDKPSLLDDEKFALQAPDLITPTTIKSTDINLSNFKIIIPTAESPSISQVLNEDSLNYFATKISAGKPTNDSLSPVSSDTNNVKTSVTNKMKSILNVCESATKLKELIDQKVENISSSAKNTSVNDNNFVITPHPQNESATSSTAVNLLEVISAESQHSLCSEETGKYRYLAVKSTSRQEGDNKKKGDDEKKSDPYKRDGDEKGNDNLDDNDSSGSKNLAQGQLVKAAKVDTINLVLEQKSKKLAGKSTSRQEDDHKKKGGEKRSDPYRGAGDEKGNDDLDYGNNSSGSKNLVQGQFVKAVKADAINLVLEQKSKKLKDKVKSIMTEEVQSASYETARTELQMKKASSKLSLSNKCDSQLKKGIFLKSSIDNNQPELALETNKQLTNKNEDKVEADIPTSESSVNLRFLRMKKSLPNELSDQTASKNKKLKSVSETHVSHNQISKSKKSLNNSGNVAAINNSEAVTAINSSGNVGSSNDGDNCSKSLDDCNAAVGDRDIVVKKEKPDNEIFTNRNCPYCYLDFAYLSNFRRHLKVCTSKTLNAASEAPVSSASSQFQHLPKKNEVEESMLNLLRHQSRQNELIKETQKADDNKVKNTFKKFSCQECHKIYLSYFSYMQHVVKVHKMTQDTKTTDPYGPSTSQGVRVMPLEETESNVHQETKTVDPNGPSTSQGVRLMPLEESGCENNIQLSEVSGSNLTALNIPSELSVNNMNSTTTVVSSVKEANQVDSNKEGNTSSDITHDESKSSNQEVRSGSIQNASRCLENLDSSNGLAAKKTFASSPDVRNAPKSQNGNELPDIPLLSLPVYGKGRGRKKKSIAENSTEKKDLNAEEQSKKIGDISSVNDPRDDNSISKTELVASKPLMQEAGKALLGDLSSPKNTLVNKLRSNLSKSMQSGGNLDATPLKLGKKSETQKNADASDAKYLQKDQFSFKSPIKKITIETSKDKIDVPSVPRPLNTSKRGRKKSVARVSVKQNVRGFKQESNDNLSQIDVPVEAIESSVKAIETESNSGLHDTLKGNKLKSLRNQIPSGPESQAVSDEKISSIKRSISNAAQSSKMTKAMKFAKTSEQEGNPDPKSYQKSNAVNNKVKSPRGTKARCENEPTPSTSYGPSRGRKPRLINVSLDISSELEDVEDIQQSKPEPKKKHNNKLCPICKQKFPALLQRNRHVQLVHGRKRSRNEGSISPTSLPLKKETVNKVVDSPVKNDTVNKITDSTAIVPDRSTYQRQCSKPLPPMKRKYQKLGVKNFQSGKKTKL